MTETLPAAGLGRLLWERLGVLRFPVVSSLLIAFFSVSVAGEFASRRMRGGLRA